MLTRVALGAIGLMLAVHAAFADAAAQFDHAMACAQRLDPQGLLHDLQQAGFIATKPFFTIDGIPTFAVSPAFRLRGLPVKFVGGWDISGDLFTRAPGTAPGTQIFVTLEASDAEVERAFGPEARFSLSDEITAYGYHRHPGLVEATCQRTD